MPKSELFRQLRRALRVADRLERESISTEAAFERAAEAEWSRRRFLQTSGAAAAGAAISPMLFTRTARADGGDAARVVILGAGTAGLTCAYRLQQAGIDAMVVEASTRVGGRMYSLANYFPDDQIAELGGELIDTEHHAIRNLARELDVELIDLAYLDGSAGHDYFIDGKLFKADADWVEMFRPVADAVRRDIGEEGENCEVNWDGGSEAGKELDAISVAEWLDRNDIDGAVRKVIAAAYVGEFGLPLEEQSALNLLCVIGTTPGTFGIFGESNERFRTRSGNGTIPIRLAQEIRRPIDLGTVVEAIRNRDAGFEITVRRGGRSVPLRADLVVSTIPLPVMRRIDLKGLELTPVLRGMVEELGYGTNSKMMVGLDSRPWVQMNVSAYTFTDLPFQACWETSRGQAGQHGILTNFTGGRQGLVIGEGALQERAREFVKQADRVFPGVAAAYTGKAVRQIWPKYEWTQGSYSCFRPGQYQKYFRAMDNPHGNFVFAGEHTVDESGFMNSAVESGERAASHVLGILGIARIKAA